jgi:hypothetical protein
MTFMHGLTADIDLSFLTGRELIQVAVGRYQVIFAFDENVAISVESTYEFHNGSGISVWTPGTTQATAAALALLGATVTNARVKADGTLTLNFTGERSLVILNSNEKCESYQITKPGDTIVV